jgi:hypothetical protein
MQMAVMKAAQLPELVECQRNAGDRDQKCRNAQYNQSHIGGGSKLYQTEIENRESAQQRCRKHESTDNHQNHDLRRRHQKPVKQSDACQRAANGGRTKKFTYHAISINE